MALPGKYIEELTELTVLDGTEKAPASKTGATEDYWFSLTTLKNWVLSLTGLSFKENVTFEKKITALNASIASLTDGYIPYHVSDVLGLANSAIFQSGNNVGVGTTAPAAKVDIIGSLLVSSNETNSTIKALRAGNKHYTNAEEPFYSIYAESNSTNNILLLGGGTVQGNAATQIDFYTGATNTTTTGTLRGQINSAGNWGIKQAPGTDSFEVNGIIRSTDNYKKNSFFVTKNLAASANITGATAVNIQMNASTDYEYVISPGITATLNFNDASFQYNSITMVYATGGTALKLTSTGVTFYQNGAALVGDTVAGYDGTKLNEIGIKVLSSTKFLVVRG